MTAAGSVSSWNVWRKIRSNPGETGASCCDNGRRPAQGPATRNAYTAPGDCQSLTTSKV
jgi:hypothetical protein